MREPKIKYIEMKVRDLVIHPVAQRELNESRVVEFNKNLNLDAIGVIHAVRYAREEGITRTFVVDGQHRLRTLESAELFDYEVMVAIHIDVKDDAAAADLFLDLNNKVNVTAIDKFTKGVVAGRSEATTINQIIQLHGLTVSQSYSSRTVCCVATLHKLQRWGVLDTALRWAHDAWGKSAESHEGKVLEGLGIVKRVTNGNLEEPALLKKLARYPNGPSGLLSDAKGRRKYERGSMGMCVAKAIIAEYNKGRRSGQVELSNN